MEPSSYYRSHTTVEPSSPCKRLTVEPIKDTSGEFSQQFQMRFAEGVELGTEPEGQLVSQATPFAESVACETKGQCVHHLPTLTRWHSVQA